MKEKFTLYKTHVDNFNTIFGGGFIKSEYVTNVVDIVTLFNTIYKLDLNDKDLANVNQIRSEIKKINLVSSSLYNQDEWLIFEKNNLKVSDENNLYPVYYFIHGFFKYQREHLKHILTYVRGADFTQLRFDDEFVDEPSISYSKDGIESMKKILEKLITVAGEGYTPKGRSAFIESSKSKSGRSGIGDSDVIRKLTALNTQLETLIGTSANFGTSGKITTGTPADTNTVVMKIHAKGEEDKLSIKNLSETSTTESIKTSNTELIKDLGSTLSASIKDAIGGVSEAVKEIKVGYVGSSTGSSSGSSRIIHAKDCNYTSNE